MKIEYTQNDVNRFWGKVDFDPNDQSSCWYWNAHYSVSQGGYGRMNVGGTVYHSNQLSYLFYNKQTEIPEGLFVLHSRICVERAEQMFGEGTKSRLCCNPLHLRLGTHKDNAQDTKEQGRMKGIFRKGRKGDKGENHPQHKLSSLDVDMIKQDTRPHAQIARVYKINQSTVSRIKSGQRRREG